MNTTVFASLIATLLTLQGVKSYNDSQTIPEPEPFAMTQPELKSLHSAVTSCASGIRSWHGMTVTTAEQWASTPAQKASAQADREEFERGCARQDSWLALFTAILTALGLQDEN